MANLKIVNGRVIDGSGRPGCHATVPVADAEVAYTIATESKLAFIEAVWHLCP